MRILLPVDGSDCSNEMMHWASNTFDKASTAYSLISVIPIVMDFPIVEEQVSGASEVLRQAKEKMEELGCHIEAAEQVLGFPGNQICQYADTINADLVIIGSHGHSGLNRLLLGSVSESVLEHCKKSVIVYREARKSGKDSNIKPALTSTIF